MNTKDNPKKRVFRDGVIEYRLCGKFHRTDGPVIEHSNGSEYWYRNGKLHREAGPAVVRVAVKKEWFIQNKPFKGPKK